jgi:hypothetical protein
MSALVEPHVFDFIRCDAGTSAIRAIGLKLLAGCGRLRHSFASWERRRPAGPPGCDRQFLADETSALPKPAIRLNQNTKLMAATS